jgi:hypothetical protein
MREKDIRSKFDTARYQFTIATDMGSYLSMVNEDDPFLKWRVDWYLAWRDGRYTPKATLRTYLRDAVKADFLTVYKQLNLDNELVKVAECSNFASHALAILLQDQLVVDEYNICLASIGPSLNHTIVILLPKDALPIHANNNHLTLEQIPKGAFIVDPWAMSMGYEAEVSLAVEPSSYIYYELLEKITLPYQSMNDPTVHQKTPNSLIDTNSRCKLSPLKKLELGQHLFGTPKQQLSSLEETSEEIPTPLKKK